MPRRVLDRTVTGAQLGLLFGRLLPAVRRVEQLSRPRLGFMFGVVGDRLIGLVDKARAGDLLGRAMFRNQCRLPV